MPSPITSGHPPENLSGAPNRDAIIEPDFTGPPQPIEAFAVRPDFPKCTLGQFIALRGYAGVVVEIVNQSMKVRSPDGITQSFNFHRLRILYGSAPEPSASDPDRTEERPMEASLSAPPMPAKREAITDPNFDRDVKAIRVFASRPDFPECAFGEYVDIRGYAGVVVDIVAQSLKVKARDGGTRSFNVDVLRKLYGKP